MLQAMRLSISSLLKAKSPRGALAVVSGSESPQRPLSQAGNSTLELSKSLSSLRFRYTPPLCDERLGKMF